MIFDVLMETVELAELVGVAVFSVLTGVDVFGSKFSKSFDNSKLLQATCLTADLGVGDMKDQIVVVQYDFFSLLL